MKNRTMGASSRHALWMSCLAILVASQALGQSAWRPDKAVEIIVPAAAGGPNDRAARLTQKILQAEKLLPVPTVILNKPGGNQTVAVAYLIQKAGDAHHLLYTSSTVFTNEITGLTKMHYKDITPVAMLFNEITVIAVRADSPVKTMRDMSERLKLDPESMVFGSVARGGPNHLALIHGLKVAGVDAHKLKIVIFNSNGDSMVALVGGHIHAVASAASSALPQVQAGNARMIAIAAPQRMTGVLASVPTLREQGLDSTGAPNWRGYFGARGLSAAQIDYWDEILAKTTGSDEWGKYLEANNLAGQYLRSREFSKYLEGEYGAMRKMMTELGLAK